MLYKFKLLVRYIAFITRWKQLGKTEGAEYELFIYTLKSVCNLDKTNVLQNIHGEYGIGFNM